MLTYLAGARGITCSSIVLSMRAAELLWALVLALVISTKILCISQFIYMYYYHGTTCSNTLGKENIYFRTIADSHRYLFSVVCTEHLTDSWPWSKKMFILNNVSLQSFYGTKANSAYQEQSPQSGSPLFAFVIFY